MDLTVVVSVVSALIAFLAFLASVQQARIAQAQTRLQQQAHEDAAQPYLWADFIPDEEHGGFFLLVLQNQGPTTATDVAIEFDPPLPQGWHKEKAVGPATGFASLPPGRRMYWRLGTTWDRLADGEITRFGVTLTGRGPYGPVRTHYDLDMADYRTGAQRVPGNLYGVAQSIDKLTKQIAGA